MNLLARLRAMLADLLDIERVQLVAPVDSGAITPYIPRVLVCKIKATGTPQALTGSDAFCRWAIIAAGPKLDGTSANAAPLIIGTDTRAADAAGGLLIAPGGSLSLPGMNLGRLFVAGTLDDVVRVMYAE